MVRGFRRKYLMSGLNLSVISESKTYTSGGLIFVCGRLRMIDCRVGRFSSNPFCIV